MAQTVLTTVQDFNVDTVLFQLQKAKFPSHKWKSLANGLRVASLVTSIEANNVKDMVGMLQELISRWVGSTTGNQWVMLIDAVVMCDEPAVAEEVATAVGCPLALSECTSPVTTLATCTTSTTSLDTTASNTQDRRVLVHSSDSSLAAQAKDKSQEPQESVTNPITIRTSAADSQHKSSGPDSQAAEDVMKSMTHSSASEPSSSIWQIKREEAEYILTYKPDGTFLVREKSGKPVTDPSSSSINTHVISFVVNGRVAHVSIYKRGQYYGSLNNEKYTSVEHCVADFSRTGFTINEGATLVTLTNRLFPDKDTLANLPSDIPTIRESYTFSDAASLVPKHYPHHDESTWLCRQLSKEESERLLRGRIDETFLLRATDLSGPNHLFTVDIVLQRKVISLDVYKDGDWLTLEG